jgi:4-amino-4-deoxy-L-arabinose transferase-like glycosyltransferase
MSPRQQHWVLVGIVLGYLICGAIYSVVVPVLEAPDESNHFFVVVHLVERRALPVQREEARGPWGQEGSQPPLYYLVGALLVSGIDLSDAEDLLWTNPQANVGDPTNPGNKNVYIHPATQRYPWHGAVLAVHVLRGLSLLLGAMTVVLAWRIAGLVFPRKPLLPLAAAGVVAFIPQFVFVTASVSNDNAMTFLGTLALYMFLRLLVDQTSSDGTSTDAGRASTRRWTALGAVLGLALLSKLSALALLGLAAIAILLVAWHRGSPRLAWRAGLAVAVPAIAIAGWWYVRNVVLYGEPTGLSAMWAMVGRRDDFGQDLWGEFRALRYSFWGLFGWFSIAMPVPIYRILDLLTALALAGLGVGAVRWLATGQWRGAWSAFRYREPGWGAAYRPLAYGLLGLWLGVMLIALVRWTSLTPGTQGRLVYPAIAAFSILFVAGLRTWFLPRLRDAAAAGAGLGLLALAGAVPWLWLAPAYAQPVPVDALPQGVIPLEIVFGDAIVLRGVGYEQAFVHPGDALKVRLYWETLRTPGAQSELMVALHLVDPNGDFLGVEDSYMGAGALPSPLWSERQLLAGWQYVRVGSDADTPLVARLHVSMYDRGTGEGLPTPGNEVATVGRIKIVPQRWPRVGEKEVVAQLGAEPPAEGQPRITLAGAAWPDGVRAGGSLPVTLTWSVGVRPKRDYSVFVHLEDEAGQVYGYGDGAPRGGRYPVWAWAEGEVIEDEHAVSIDPAASRGRYHIVAGLYDAGGRMAAYKADGTRWANDAIDLGTVGVVR